MVSRERVCIGRWAPPCDWARLRRDFFACATRSRLLRPHDVAPEGYRIVLEAYCGQLKVWGCRNVPPIGLEAVLTDMISSCGTV